MHIELKRTDGSVIWTGDAVLAADAVSTHRANLLGANLSGADLRGADLSGADLRQALIGNPSRLLEAFWGDASDDLCRLLMAYDEDF